MRLFSGSLATETNTFAPMPTGMATFRESGYFRAGTHPDGMTLFSAPLWAARQRCRENGWTLIEGMVAFAQPSGITTRSVYEALRDELLEDLRQALPVDVVLLGLHGAMVADGYDDCEGDLLERVRRLVGPGVVIGAELDPHCHLTQAMLSHADLLIAFKEYPHTDARERAFELVDLCVATARKTIRPVAAVADTGTLCVIHTTREPARSFVDRIQSLEGRQETLSISIAHGFPWGDVADLGTKVLVYADGDHTAAQTLAQALATELKSMRGALSGPAMPNIDQALDQAIATEGGPVVIADGADNPGGGASGDSTFFLARMIERRISPAALGPLWDPTAVRIAFEAGAGARLMLRIGGKVGPLSGQPLDLDCTVRALVPDLKMSALSNTRASLGDSALVTCHGIDIALVSIRNQAMGTDMFTQLGCDLAVKKAIVVKSSQHFYASYSKIARRVIYAAAPGAVTSDLSTLPYRKASRSRIES